MRVGTRLGWDGDSKVGASGMDDESLSALASVGKRYERTLYGAGEGNMARRDSAKLFSKTRLTPARRVPSSEESRSAASCVLISCIGGDRGRTERSDNG